MGDDRVLAALRAWVHQGRFLPGSRVPSLRTIAALVGCTRHAAHQAVLALEREGLLVRRSPYILTVAGRAPSHEDLARTVVVFAAVHAMRAHVADPEQARYTGGTPRMLAGLERAAAAAGLTVSVFPPDPDLLGRFEALARLRPLGWIFTNAVYGSPGGNALFDAVLGSGQPVAAWADTLLPAELARLPCDALLADHRGGAAALVRHLAGRGARHLLPVVLPGVDQAGERTFRSQWMVDRLAGYADGAREAGVVLAPAQPFLARRYTTDPACFAESVMTLGGVIAPHLAGPDPVDGLLAPEDGCATALACAARRLGRELPVAGYDATWEQRPECAWGPPPAVSLDQDWAGIGAGLLALLLARSADPRAPVRRQYHPGRLAQPQTIFSSDT